MRVLNIRMLEWTYPIVVQVTGWDERLTLARQGTSNAAAAARVLVLAESEMFPRGKADGRQ